MPPSEPYSDAFTLRVRERDGWLVVTSPEMPGLYVASNDHAKAMADVLPAIKAIRELGSKAVAAARREEGNG